MNTPGIINIDDRGVVEVDPAIYKREDPGSGFDVVTCGHCGRSWDDAVSTAWTPAPSGRCPYEEDHVHPEERLEYLREELRFERISYGELAELEDLRAHIRPDDFELLEALSDPEPEHTIGFRVEITGEYGDADVDIVLYDGEEELVMWTSDEWREDPSLVAVIVNAVNIGHTEGADAIRKRLE